MGRYSVFDYFICPHCEAEVPADAPACPQCGSDEETGWSEGADYAHLFLYDDEPEPKALAAWVKPLGTVLTALALSVFLASSLPWGVYLIPLVFLVVGTVYYATRIFPRTRYAMQRRLYQSLVQKARGDEKLVERLIEYEQQRSPGLDKIQLLRDAVDRWEHDLR
ncbi:MAG: hypothetical protein GY832_33990 [Chloroflexi bacterium]|nr:hypothetical protein [Chloroflexota bacterium]